MLPSTVAIIGITIAAACAMRCVQLAGERAGDHDQSIGISIHVALSCWQSWSRGSQRPFSCASFCRVLRFHHREQLCFHWRAESGACAAARSRLVFVYADDYLLEQPVRSKDPRTMAASPAQCLLAMPVHLSHVLCPFRAGVHWQRCMPSSCSARHLPARGSRQASVALRHDEGARAVGMYPHGVPSGCRPVVPRRARACAFSSVSATHDDGSEPRWMAGRGGPSFFERNSREIGLK